MANVSRVNGFKPVFHLSGAPYNGQVRKYTVTAGDSTALFVGDLVIRAGDASADGYATVTQAAQTATGVLGAIVGFDYNPLNLNVPIYRAASTARIVYVADAPDLVYEVQASATTSTPDVGLNVNITVAAGSTTTGASGMQILSSSVTTTNTMTLSLIGLVDRVDNDLTAANSKVLVRINNHAYVSGTGVTGV